MNSTSFILSGIRSLTKFEPLKNFWIAFSLERLACSNLFWWSSWSYSSLLRSSESSMSRMLPTFEKLKVRMTSLRNYPFHKKIVNMLSQFFIFLLDWWRIGFLSGDTLPAIFASLWNMVKNWCFILQVLHGYQYAAYYMRIIFLPIFESSLEYVSKFQIL